MEWPPFASIKRSLILLTILLPLSALAQTGADRIGTGQCPEDAEASMVYSPFKPYFAFEMFKGNRQNCWTAADCLFEAAGESRKQQFAATALVMGLIPLTLKDIAWPERRLIHVTERLNVFVEILVLALGLVPSQTGNRAKTRKKNVDGNLLAAAAWGMSRPTLILYAVLCALGVVGSYAGLVIMEVYSKRSALGCPVPIFVAAWYVVALVPAGIHSLFAAFRRSRYRRRNARKQAEEDEQGGYLLAERAAGDRQAKQQGGVSNVKASSEEESERKKKIISAVQGADEDWPVQMAWGVYYIAGTLIFTSVMAVTVIELIVWVALGFAVTGSSKVLAFFLCMVFEETGKEGVQRNVQEGYED